MCKDTKNNRGEGVCTSSLIHSYHTVCTDTINNRGEGEVCTSSLIHVYHTVCKDSMNEWKGRGGVHLV